MFIIIDLDLELLNVQDLSFDLESITSRRVEP